jgi:hypothetical protein
MPYLILLRMEPDDVRECPSVDQEAELESFLSTICYANNSYISTLSFNGANAVVTF